MHRIASLIAVAALVLSTACGTSAPPAERLAAAPAATVEQGTAKVAFSTSTEVQGQSIESTGEGAVDFDGRMEGAEGGGSVTTTVEYFDFGAEVDVEAPPEDEVTDITELMGG